MNKVNTVIYTRLSTARRLATRETDFVSGFHNTMLHLCNVSNNGLSTRPHYMIPENRQPEADPYSLIAIISMTIPSQRSVSGQFDYPCLFAFAKTTYII